MRRCFVVLYNRDFETTFFPPGHNQSPEDFIGRKPWECAVPEDEEMVKASFQTVIDGGIHSFHIVRLLDAYADFKGQKLCAWLTRVDNRQHACFAIMCRCAAIPEKFDELTQRERDVLSVLAEGKSPRVIANEMRLAVSTVHTFLSRVREKLDLEDLVQVAAWSVNYQDILLLKDYRSCS